MLVKFIQGYESYRKGELAGFDKETADNLVKNGYAEKIENVILDNKIKENIPVIIEKSVTKKMIELMKKKEKIADIIIPHHDRHDLLKNVLDKLPNDIFNIIICSGGTFAENCNKGAKIAKTDNLIFMNDDIVPDISQLIMACEMEEDIVGFRQKLVSQGDVIVYGIGWSIKENGEIYSDLRRGERSLHIPSGFLMRVKKDVWKKLKGFNEDFINGGEDLDFGLRALEMEMSIGFIKDENPIIHYHQQSSGRMDHDEKNKELFKKIWPDERIKKAININDNRKTKILITNYSMKHYSGSETFTYTLGMELKRRGYEVDLFTFEEGELSSKFFTITPDNYRGRLRDKYNYIFINHNNCLEFLKNIKGFKVFISHGIYPKLEQPKDGADMYVAISQEVKDHLNKLGYKSVVINNGIDCDRFRPKKEIHKKLKNVLSLCKNEMGHKIVEEACKKLNLNLLYAKEESKIEDKINKVDLVVSLGRGAYEAMACGRAVLVFDKRGYMNAEPKGDGIVDGNARELLKNNFSGRRYNKRFDADDLVKELKKYKKEMGKENRKFALKHLNIKKQVDLLFKEKDKKTKNRITFIDSSETPYGIAKQLEQELKNQGYNIGQGGRKICYASDVGIRDPYFGGLQIPEERPSFKEAIKSNADHIFVAQKDCMKFFKGKPHSYLPSAIDDKIFKDYNLKRDIDIGFVGTDNINIKSRVRFINFLKKRFDNFVREQGIFFEDMAEFYNRCKIVPNQCPADDINMRTFEATACGALLITPNLPYLKELFEIGKEIVVYDDILDLEKKINYYLKHDKEREKIARAGQIRTLKDHTYSKRVEKIIKTLNG